MPFSLRKVIQSNRREIRFFSLFIAFFLLGQTMYYLLYSTVEPVLVHKLNAEIGSKIINALTPQERTIVQDKLITSGSSGFGVQIVQGCDGTEGMIILAAAIWAFRMSFVRKILGSLMGCFFIYLANLIRIVGLYYCLKYQPDIFNVSHVYIGQVFIILMSLVFFVVWISRFAGGYESSGQRA